MSEMQRRTFGELKNVSAACFRDARMVHEHARIHTLTQNKKLPGKRKKNAFDAIKN